MHSPLVVISVVLVVDLDVAVMTAAVLAAFSVEFAVVPHCL